MKYARLSLEDLKDLEKEFIEFLVINGIPANEWEHIKKNDMQKAESIVDQFSDVVWEGILRKHTLVEKRNKELIIVSKVSDAKITTIYITATRPTIDLTVEANIRSCMESNELEVRKQITEINNGSEQEQLFQFLTLGFYLADQQLYASLFQKD